MPPALVITRGLPGSGKTTWARAWVAEDDRQRVRVNRDDLRDMLFGGWTGVDEHEAAVTAAQHAAVAALLRAGRSVVCDDTNLHPETVESFVRLTVECGAVLAVHDLTGVPVDVCVARDAARLARGDRGVGERVIREMFERCRAEVERKLAGSGT